VTREKKATESMAPVGKRKEKKKEGGKKKGGGSQKGTGNKNVM